MRMLDRVRDIVGGATVFQEPFVKDGVTVISASHIWAGGGGGEDGGAPAAGGGGAGVIARPAGAFVIKGETVKWVPALDVNRFILGSQILTVVAILAWRSVAKARARRRL